MPIRAFLFFIVCSCSLSLCHPLNEEENAAGPLRLPQRSASKYHSGKRRELLGDQEGEAKSDSDDSGFKGKKKYDSEDGDMTSYKKSGSKSKSGKNGKKETEDYYMEISPFDMGIRFSKIGVQGDDIPEGGYVPLTAEDYPITPETAEWLRQSLVHSLVIDENCGPNCPVPIASLVEYNLGGLPTYPSHDPNDPFWDELRFVIWAQEQRRMGVDPRTVMPLPAIWEQFTIAEVAKAVHNEMPGAHHLVLIQSLLAEGARVDPTIIAPRCVVDFLRGIVMLAQINTWAPALVGPMNFGVKYYAGRPRPEEVVFLIAKGEITEEDGVPSDIVESVMALNLERAEDFTAYPEGSPLHPSWPAMHSAASSASLWIGVIMDLTPEQFCQVQLVDYAVAQARTVAGVHYTSDNDDGLILGQDLISAFLPTHLAQMYDSDPKVVEEKIERIRFDWKDFATSNCAKSFSMQGQ